MGKDGRLSTSPYIASTLDFKWGRLQRDSFNPNFIIAPLSWNVGSIFIRSILRPGKTTNPAGCLALPRPVLVRLAGVVPGVALPLLPSVVPFAGPRSFEGALSYNREYLSEGIGAARREVDDPLQEQLPWLCQVQQRVDLGRLRLRPPNFELQNHLGQSLNTKGEAILSYFW